MKVLLDTHVVLWWRAGSRRLSSPLRSAISDAEKAFVSMASAWEVAVLLGLKRIELDESFEAGLAQAGFEPLPIKFAHAERLARLPRHHRDPFDRMLVAQAQVEDLTLVTVDRHLGQYDVPIVSG